MYIIKRVLNHRAKINSKKISSGLNGKIGVMPYRRRVQSPACGPLVAHGQISSDPHLIFNKLNNMQPASTVDHSIKIHTKKNTINVFYISPENSCRPVTTL